MMSATWRGNIDGNVGSSRVAHHDDACCQGCSQCFLISFINEYYYLQIIVQGNGCDWLEPVTTQQQPVTNRSAAVAVAVGEIV
jgi:uncharacterized cysteine cluster protein YcgN (CxxCxxCC family)